MVSADEATGKNYIVYWVPLSTAEIHAVDQLIIYRKQGTNTSFGYLASINANSSMSSSFTDVTANTSDTTKYAIAYLYNDGSISELSPWHQAVVVKYNGNGNVTWTKYRKEDQMSESYISGYRYVKSNSNGGLLGFLGNLLTNVTTSVFDILWFLTPQAKYRVEAELPSCASNAKADIHTSRSNIKQQNVSPASSNIVLAQSYPYPATITAAKMSLDVEQKEILDVKIVPNPTVSDIKIVIPTNQIIDGITITDLKGSILYLNNDLMPNEIIIGTSQFENGIYLVHFETEGTVITKRLIVSH